MVQFDNCSLGGISIHLEVTGCGVAGRGVAWKVGGVGKGERWGVGLHACVSVAYRRAVGVCARRGVRSVRRSSRHWAGGGSFPGPAREPKLQLHLDVML